MDDFLGLGRIIKEQQAKIERLELENRLLFDSIKGDEADLARFNAVLERALSAGQRQ